ncbi:MAG: hypothetical protein GKR98_04480 [Boseongicola sp.]|nr:MAG: hypothetical protein GKR98_04480 [Boseongicola sp.]
MKRIMTAASITAAATAAHAGGIERTNQSVNVLFEEGRYLEFSLSGVSPTVSGVGGLLTPGLSSGDMTETYLQFGAAYKADLNDTWSYAIFYDQPYGADVNYPGAPGPGSYFAAGSTAEFNSQALTGIVQYILPSNVSFHAGLRVQSIEATAVVPFLGAYSADGERDFAMGYLVGAAYEKPEIALRVALTYISDINHSLTTTENSGLGPDRVSPTLIDTPQALNLEFQSGVAEDTLVFGSIRWVEWSEFSITPTDYGTISGGAPLVGFDDDRITYNLGVGRRLNETWSVLGSVSYEEQTGSPTGNLGPTDGRLGATIGAVYTRDNVRVTGGISYVDVGDANTRVGLAVPAGAFSGNYAIGAGIRVGYTF